MSLILTAYAAMSSSATGAPFDPVAATDAYLATVKGAARARSDAYFEGGYWLLLWGAIVNAGAIWLLLATGVVRRLADWSSRVGRKAWAGRLIFAVIFLALLGIVTLPWTIYTEWAREHQYGMSNQGFADWFGQWAMGAAISTILSGLVFLALFALYRRRPGSWWAWGTAVLGVFFLIGLLVAPVFIEPLFNRYTPMAPGPLRDQILVMARANGVPAENVLVFDASRQTKRISANVAGIGPTVRVALNDNLLNQTSAPEVRAVMGHELGHYVLGHTASLIVGFTLIAGLSLLLLHLGTPWLIVRAGGRWGVSVRDDPAILGPAMIVGVAIGLLLTPVTNTLVRFHESQADYFGINTSRAPDGWARVTLKLGAYRKLDPTPFEEAVFFDHPSGHTRILMGMRWKAQHLHDPGIE